MSHLNVRFSRPDLKKKQQNTHALKLKAEKSLKENGGMHLLLLSFKFEFLFCALTGL